MKEYVNKVLLLFLLQFVPLLVMGEESVVQHRIVLRSGRVVTGEIVQRNDEVVIVKDSYGARFQYPMPEVEEITEIVEETDQSVPEEEVKEERVSRKVTNVKRTSLGVRVAGGVMSLDGTTGGSVAADVRLGANNLGGRRIFLGGQVGYRALMAQSRVLSVIPINAVLELPLMQGDHTPLIGANIGYGVGIGFLGGVNAGLSLGYRYHFSRTGAFHIGVEAEVQQLASSRHSVFVDTDQRFESTGGMTAVMGMLTLGVLF